MEYVPRNYCRGRYGAGCGSSITKFDLPGTYLYVPETINVCLKSQSTTIFINIAEWLDR